jgi:hypothetical protein
MTDAAYYGASVSQVSPPSDTGINYTISFNPVATLWGVGITGGNVYGYWDGTLMFNVTASPDTVSYTTGGYTYLRGTFYGTYTNPDSGSLFYYYRIARI